MLLKIGLNVAFSFIDERKLEKFGLTGEFISV